MSGTGLRAALHPFDDAALATLASKGLLRRAGRDLEAGKVALVEERDDRAVVTADGETVEIGADGPAAANCSCRAQGVCRHRLAAVLLLRGAAPTDADGADPEETPQAPAVAPGDPLAEILALSRVEIANWAGKATLRAAEEICNAASDPAIDVEDAALVVRLDPDTAEIRFLAGQGLAGMISKAPRAKRKALHAAAILAVRRRHLQEETASDEVTPEHDAPAAATPADPEFLEEVARCLGDCIRTGFNQAPLVLEERLFALSVSSRADALPRLSTQLRTLAARVREKRERDFSLDLDAYLVLVGETHALAQALLAETGAPLDIERSEALRGQVRQVYRPVGNLTLYGMGARTWRTAAGASGATGYFYAPDPGLWYSAGSARAHAHDSTYSPRRAYESDVLWSAGTLSEISRCRVVLQGAAASPDGRLSLSDAASAQATPWTARETDIADWSIALDDWTRLEDHLHASFPVGLGSRSRGPLPVVLRPRSAALPYFDELAQETVWPLRDVGNAWLALTLAHEEGIRSAPREFEAILRSEKPWAVAALALPGRRSFELVPYALFLAGANGGCLNIGLDRARSAGVGRAGSLLRRLGREAASAFGIGAGSFARPASADATGRMLAEASDALLGIAELGGASDPSEIEKLHALAARLQDLGLEPNARSLMALRPDDKKALPRRLLEAVYLIDMTRSLLRPLPSLSPV